MTMAYPATWPRSLLGLPLAALVLGIQALPMVSLVSNWLQYLPGAILYGTAIGLGAEALLGRAPLGWLAVPLVTAALSAVPRWQERTQVEAEREWIAREDDPAPGHGTSEVPVTVNELQTATSLVRRYDVPLVYARRDITSVDFLAVTRVQNGFAVTSVEDEPQGTVTLYYQASPFRRGRLEGMDLRLTANWPSGLARVRTGVRLQRVGIPAYPLAGCPSGDWMKAEPCRIRWLRPVFQTFGYRQASTPDEEADTIARLIGLRRRPTVHAVAASRRDRGSDEHKRSSIIARQDTRPSPK